MKTIGPDDWPVAEQAKTLNTPLMDTPSLLQAIGALAFVLALMGLLWLGMRRFGLTMPIVPPGLKRRVQIVDAVNLDHRHRAVLIRRDDVEHLVILSPTGETVVETGITPPPENK